MQTVTTNTNLKIRNFEPSPAEYEEVVAVHNSVWKDNLVTVEQLRYRDETRSSKFLFQRIVAEVDGKIRALGGYMEPIWSYREGKYDVLVAVQPDHRRQGIGSSMYHHIMEKLKERNATTITTSTRENQKAGLAMLAKHGFNQVMRYPVSHLNVDAFDADPFAGITEKVRDEGFDIVTLPELRERDPNWLENFHEAFWQIEQDVPSPDTLTKIPIDEFKSFLDAPHSLPEAHFFALHEGKIAGVSWLSKNLANKKLLHTGLTGVLRNYRRKGVATALKLRAIRFARKYGAEIIDADNEENNPMFDLNMKLGFEPQPAWLDFEKTVSG